MEKKDPIQFYQTELNKITYQLFLKAVKEIAKQPITSRAPFGYSTKDIILFGREAPGRQSCVSVRNHSGMYSMLITTPGGNFLFSGGFSMSLTNANAAKGLYRAFKLVKHLVK